MMRTKHFIPLTLIFFIGSFIFSACGGAISSQRSDVAIPTELTTAKSEVSISAKTNITIDGSPEDWSNYQFSIDDPIGDNKKGGFDIISVRAFQNDAFLYILVEADQPPSDFIQLDLAIRSGQRTFLISFWPGTSNEPHMGEVTTGEWKDVGVVKDSQSALGKAVEIKMPLFYFEDPSDLELRNIRPMNGQCCAENWYAIDETSSIRINQLKEVEPESGIADLPPRVCADMIAPPAPFGFSQPAPIKFDKSYLNHYNCGTIGTKKTTIELLQQWCG